MRHFKAGQELGDDAHGATAGGECGVCQRAHQADAPAPEHEVDTGISEPSSQLHGGGTEGGVVAWMGPAEDGDATNFRHGSPLWRDRARVSWWRPAPADAR